MSIWATDESVATTNAGSAFASGPDTGLIENIPAGFRAVRARETNNALERQRADAYRPIIEALNEGQSWASRWVNPWAGQAILPEGGKVRSRNAWMSPAVTPQEQEEALWTEISRRRETDPNFLPGLPKTRDEFEAAILQAANDTVAAAEDIRSRATALGHVGYFLGAIGGAFTDPVNIITLPIGAARALGQGIARVIAKEAAINAAIEAASQPAIATNYEALGQEFGLGDAAFNVATAGVGAGLIRGGIEVAPKAIDWTREGTRALVEKMRAKPTRTPDENAALNVLEADLEIRESNPFPDDPRGTAAHQARLAEAMDNLDAGRPVDLPDLPEDMYPEPLRLEHIARARAERAAREAAEREAFLAENPMPKRRPPSLIDELRAELRRRGKSLNLADAISYGAIHPDDLKSDVGLKMLFRKNGGMSLDQMGEWFREQGFGGAAGISAAGRAEPEEIAAAMAQDVAGRKTAQGVYSKGGQEEAQAYRDWLAADEAWQRRYEPPEMAPPPRIEDMTDEEYLALEREAIQAEEFAVRGAEGIYDDIPFDETGDVYPAPGAGRPAESPLQPGAEPRAGGSNAGGPGGQRGPQEGGPAADGARGLGGARDSAAAQEWLDSFSDPAGSGQKTQADRLDHDIRAAVQDGGAADFVARIRTFVADALTIKDRRVALGYGRVAPDTAQKITTATGIDVAGYRHEIDNYAVRHIQAAHGDAAKEAGRGQAAIGDADWALLPEIVRAPDKLAAGGKTKQGRDTIRYEKQIGDSYYLVEEVRTGRKVLAPVTFYKRPGGGDAGPPRVDAPKGPAPDVRDVLAGRAEDIAQTGENINLAAADDLLALDPDFAVRLADEGDPVRLADLLDDLDKDQAFLADVEGCL